MAGGGGTSPRPHWLRRTSSAQRLRLAPRGACRPSNGRPGGAPLPSPRRRQSERRRGRARRRLPWQRPPRQRARRAPLRSREGAAPVPGPRSPAGGGQRRFPSRPRLRRQLFLPAPRPRGEAGAAAAAAACPRAGPWRRERRGEPGRPARNGQARSRRRRSPAGQPARPAVPRRAAAGGPCPAMRAVRGDAAAGGSRAPGHGGPPQASPPFSAGRTLCNSQHLPGKAACVSPGDFASDEITAETATARRGVPASGTAAGGTAPSDREGTRRLLTGQRSPRPSHGHFQPRCCVGSWMPSTRCQAPSLSPSPPLRKMPWSRATETSAQLRGASPAVPQEKHAGQPLHTEASFIDRLYQAHICSATVRDGIQGLTSNPKGGTWLRGPAQREKCTERSGERTRVQHGAQAMLLAGSWSQ